MELNLTVDELRFLQILLLGSCPDPSNAEPTSPELEALDLSTTIEDQLLVKFQDALDGWTVSANSVRK